MQSSTSTQVLMVRIFPASVLREGEGTRKFVTIVCASVLGRRPCDDTVLDAIEWEGKESWKVW